jgi:hypothetical protein
MYTGIFHIIFHMDPGNPDGSIISSNQELDNLAELLDVGSKEIEHCLTFKTVTAVSDKYEVPLKASDAKATMRRFFSAQMQLHRPKKLHVRKGRYGISKYRRFGSF